MSDLNPSPELSVVMITMNEEGAVALVIKQIRAVAPGAEILIVDSSKDQTAEIAGALGARVIKQFPPRGWNSPCVPPRAGSSSPSIATTPIRLKLFPK